jgi:hypothetical protein
LVSRRLAAIRHTLNKMPSSMKGTETLLFINLVFYVVFKHTIENYYSMQKVNAIAYSFAVQR